MGILRLRFSVTRHVHTSTIQISPHLWERCHYCWCWGTSCSISIMFKYFIYSSTISHLRISQLGPSVSAVWSLN